MRDEGERTCRWCRWWNEDPDPQVRESCNGAYRQCRAEAPQLTADATVGQWPLTDAAAWCGRFTSVKRPTRTTGAASGVAGPGGWGGGGSDVIFG